MPHIRRLSKHDNVQWTLSMRHHVSYQNKRQVKPHEVSWKVWGSIKDNDVQEVSRLVGDFLDPKGAHAKGWQMMSRDNDEVNTSRLPCTQLTLIFILWYLYFSVVFHDKYQSCKYEKIQEGNTAFTIHTLQPTHSTFSTTKSHIVFLLIRQERMLYEWVLSSLVWRLCLRAVCNQRSLQWVLDIDQDKIYEDEDSADNGLKDLFNFQFSRRKYHTDNDDRLICRYADMLIYDEGWGGGSQREQFCPVRENGSSWSEEKTGVGSHLDSIAVSLFSNTNYSETSKLVYSHHD